MIFTPITTYLEYKTYSMIFIAKQGGLRDSMKIHINPYTSAKRKKSLLDTQFKRCHLQFQINFPIKCKIDDSL